MFLIFYSRPDDEASSADGLGSGCRRLGTLPEYSYLIKLPDLASIISTFSKQVH